MILDGRKTAALIRKELTGRVTKLTENNITPKLVIYWIGNNPASAVYIKQKQKIAAKLGVLCQVRHYQESVQADEILNDILLDNKDGDVHGIIIQIPLPQDFNKNTLIQAINPEKDVDGLTSFNQWGLMINEPKIIPATAKGVMKLLAMNNIEIAGKKVVVVGRSNLVGLPTALMALNQNATVTICHSRTVNLSDETKQADILITACGQPEMINANYVKNGAVVVDVGISRTESILKGDVDFVSVEKEVSAISPVPGGVGPMTVICLMENLVEAAEKIKNG